MGPNEIHNRISEFSRIRKDAGGDENALAEVALFVEDVFGLYLSDEEICEINLGTHKSTEKFVIEKLKIERECAEYAE